MLLKSFNRVIEIDEKIKNLHAELASVYEERIRIVSQNTDSDQVSGSTATDSDKKILNNSKDSIVKNSSIAQQYADLTTSWKAINLKPPTLKQIERKLNQANKLIAKFDGVYGVGTFSLLLVPPVAKFGLTETQQMTGQSVLLSQALSGKVQKNHKNWRLFVVMNNNHGIEIVNPDEFMLEQNFILLGHEMSSLDLQAYLAFIATSRHLVDVDSWSILISQRDKDTGIVPCVARIGDSYRFEIDSVDALIGQNHFRPAMEIK